ncbi:MAG TPA: hypothetical protein VG347_21120 [Verrucomicrobiae bacterium]|nr:hypothetical protein [Verrucomicrobiae bacterium]
MKYYKTDSRKISYVEYWHLSRKGFLLGWWNKLIGKQMNLVRGIPGPTPLADRIISAGAVPAEIRHRLEHGISDLRAVGFDQFWYYSSKGSLTGGLSYAVEALHSSRQILAKVIYVFYRNRERTVIYLVSGLPNDTLLATTNKKRDFTPRPGHIVQRKVGADAKYLIDLHQQKLSQLTAGQPALVFNNLEAVTAFEDKFLRESYDHKIRRGTWVEMTEAEVAALRAQRTPPPLPK